MTLPFEEVFKTQDLARDTYLARLFGLFNEEVVSHWCQCPQAPYEDLGRPTLWKSGERKSTLDFTLRKRSTGEIFVTEMKCWTAYENYYYLPLENIAQVQKIKPPAFQEFLSFAKTPATFEVRVKRRSSSKPANQLPSGSVKGAILIWAAVTDSGRNNAMANFDFADVLSVETMLEDLRIWIPQQWTNKVRQLRYWSDELFNYLA